MLFVRASARYWSQLLGRRREETLEAEPQVGGGHHLAKQLVAHFTTRYDPKKECPKYPNIARTIHTKIRWRPSLDFPCVFTLYFSPGQCPAGTQYWYFFSTSDLIQFRKSSGNPKYWVLPDISGRPNILVT